MDLLWDRHPPTDCRKREGLQPSPNLCSDLRVDSQKQRHPSGGVAVSSEMVFELEGVELGADGKARALWPAELGRQGLTQQSETRYWEQATHLSLAAHAPQGKAQECTYCLPLGSPHIALLLNQ